MNTFLDEMAKLESTAIKNDKQIREYGYVLKPHKLEVSDHTKLLNVATTKRISSGIEDIDRLFEDYTLHGLLEKGIAVKDLVLLSGMSGVGKTTLAFTLFANMYKLGERAAFFSLDMHELKTWIDFKKALCGSQSNVEEMEELFNKLHRKPTLVCELNKNKVSDISVFLDSNPQDIIFIDYLDKLQPENSVQGLQEKHEHVMLELKKLIDKHNCAVVLLVQGSEDKTYNKGRPTLMNTYGGKEVRSAADHVIAVYRAVNYIENLDSEVSNITEVLGLKLRGDATKKNIYLKRIDGIMYGTSLAEETRYLQLKHEATNHKKG